MLTSVIQSSPSPVARAPLTVMRKFSPMPPRVVMIGVSTGGPQALTTLFSGAAAWFREVPIVIVIHLPPNFTSVIARNIETITKIPARTPGNGEKLLPGTIYFAPGEQHLRLMRAGSQVVLVHTDGPPQNFCKPAVDVLFRSGARAFGPEALGLVLTGMGRDGLLGSRAIVDAGGSVIAQDEASSTVWGMPGVVAREGLASAILPLSQIASAIGGLRTFNQRSKRA